MVFVKLFDSAIPFGNSEEVQQAAAAMGCLYKGTKDEDEETCRPLINESDGAIITNLHNTLLTR